ncbi:TIGR03619 family F420-dependent LLM class oxidoreductase [Streptomyces sp. WAC06614]|uniref:TIGR03619 family F420-dependent LLM class oxidoreductase n=1 Tax=Streptomyces sp. WAC06614 TaxID=2487416 RepID=UPI000F7A31E0|nr:TIGR03619 family F420-dependent LLM class oxidoreductase [Streptomyces sp. WAC06614]RSS73370.1 TIGR03619 family F420-dependent LLM class oxidoreductase [Streptomyces sp. WAC06614]
MDIGIALPQYGGHARPERIAPFAREAEEAGFGWLWVGDRSLTPVAPRDIYPGYTPENPYPPGFRTFLDPLTTLTVAAAATSRIRLATSTLNAPWYPPLLLARTLTTLDRVSAGRLVVGLGLGWMRDEYTAVGADFGRRGALLDEALDVLRGIWSAEVFGHEGAHWSIPGAHFGLRPSRPGGPPVLLGGLSPAAMRRVGRRADGWAGVALPRGAGAALWDIARKAAEEAGRDPDGLARHIRHNVAAGASAAEIAAVLDGVRASGADSCFLDLQQSVAGPEEALELGIEVLERLRHG